MTQTDAFSSVANLKQAIKDEILNPPVVKVSVLGPNLRHNSFETFHVHAHGCSDIKKNYGPGKKIGGEDGGWVLNVSSRRDVVLDIYVDIMYENGDTEDDWKQYDDLKVFPCVKFPMEAE